MADTDNLDFADADELAREARENIKEWEGGLGDWVREAKECYAMLHGDQWGEDDAESMRAQKRPLVTMNRIAAMIRGVCGLEVSQRTEVRYLAPEIGDAASAEVQNAAAKWAREQCDAEDEESEAFRDMVTCGMGWTETRIDYDEDPEGKMIIERIDPMDMRWDAMAAKKGLADSRWRARLKKLTIKDVKHLWPDKANEIAAYVEDTDGLDLVTHRNVVGDQYNNDNDAPPTTKDEVTVVQYQYWRYKYMVKVSSPNGQMADMPAARAEMMKKNGVPLTEITRFRQREYRQAILCGPVMLEDQPLHCNGFTLNCMTGMRDRNKGYWYGLVRDMIDPQRWSNKFFSTFIDIVSTNAKGGVMAETTAVEDPRKFEENWSNPRATIWLKAGGLSKIQQREAPNMPAAIPQMMEFAIGSLPHVSGINLEFLGTTNREQSGVLEYHRKQSVANGLAEYFSAMRQYRKMQGRVMLELIYAFLADGRLIRIVGKQGEQYIPLYRQASMKYDVVVDESSTAPDRKMQTWLALQELLPLALKAGLPVPPSILDYSPLPTTLAQEWKQMLANKPPMPPEMQKQMEQLQQENAQLKDKRQQQEAEFRLKAQAQEHEQQLAERELAGKLRLMEMETEGKLALKEREIMLDAAAEERKGDAIKFEREDGKISSVTDAKGRRFVIERDGTGKLVGLKPLPAPTTIQ